MSPKVNRNTVRQRIPARETGDWLVFCSSMNSKSFSFKPAATSSVVKAGWYMISVITTGPAEHLTGFQQLGPKWPVTLLFYGTHLSARASGRRGSGSVSGPS